LGDRDLHLVPPGLELLAGRPDDRLGACFPCPERETQGRQGNRQHQTDGDAELDGKRGGDRVHTRMIGKDATFATFFWWIIM
jgi:hypothetical protein